MELEGRVAPLQKSAVTIVRPHKPSPLGSDLIRLTSIQIDQAISPEWFPKIVRLGLGMDFDP
jgi:hypothetical protein